MTLPANAWSAAAGDLADWAQARLVNRRDVWGQYAPLHCRNRGRTWTAPARKHRGQVLLAGSILTQHFRGQSEGHVIGLHSTSPDNTSLWGAVDVDAHEGGTVSPAANLAAALAWHDQLQKLGLTPFLTDSNGKGGYHLRVLFDRPASTPRVFAFLQDLVKDFARFGLTAPPETFPKQPYLQRGRYGNWLRLPGRHHTRPHWSSVWNGTRWLEDAAAIGLLLGLKGSSPALIPASVVAPAPAPPPPAPRRSVFTCNAVDGRQFAARIRAYRGKLPNRDAGQNRHGVAYGFACWLARDLQLGDDQALAWLRDWNEGNRPPLAEADLVEVLTCARAYGQRPYGSGLLAQAPRPAGRRETGRHQLRQIDIVVGG